jgi:hypothetical protein
MKNDKNLNDNASALSSLPAPAPVRQTVIWRLVNKNGEGIVFDRGMVIGSDEFGQSRKAPVWPIDLDEAVKVADSSFPEFAPHRYERFVQETKIAALEQAVTHWKANHADAVERARILMDRPDLPLERVRAYGTVQRLQDENAQLLSKLESLEAR